MTADPGYSGTPLPKKLGLSDGQRVLFLDLPRQLAHLATARAFTEARGATWPDLPTAGPAWDIIHGFTASRAVLEAATPALLAAITRSGAVWIFWPKRAAKIPTDITEDVIRDIILPSGLVDVKVCAVDQTWSGLKLVIRRAFR